MTTTIEAGALDKALRTLKLSGMLATIEARLAQARAGELRHIDFLQVLCGDEISPRETTSITRLRQARFEEQATLEGFDFTASPKLPATQIRDLAALRWLHAPPPLNSVSADRKTRQPSNRAPGHAFPRPSSFTEPLARSAKNS